MVDIRYAANPTDSGPSLRNIAACVVNAGTLDQSINNTRTGTERDWAR